VGVDVDHDSLATAESSSGNMNNVRFIQSDALLFLNNNKGQTYHAIVCSHVLEHVENPIDFIQSFSKALKPGGLLICIVPNPFGLLDLCILRPQVSVKKFLNMNVKQGRDHVSGVGLSWLKKAITFSGFKIEMVLPVASIFASPLTSRSIIELIEIQTPKPMFLAYSWVIIGKKMLKPKTPF
jgi:SAM-dependent methyltransferase